MQLLALDDLQRPGAGVYARGGDPPSGIAGIGEDALDEGEKAAHALDEEKARAVAILHIGRMDDGVQQEAERANEDMPLAACDLLAPVTALRRSGGFDNGSHPIPPTQQFSWIDSKTSTKMIVTEREAGL